MHTKTETITPDRAKEYLAKQVGNQRPLSPRKIEELAREILAGKWMLTHQGIAFNDRGELLDGQHRLHAIVQANKSVVMLVTYEAPTASFSKVDQNRPRTNADIYVISGGGRYAGLVCAAARSMLCGLTQHGSQSAATRDQVVRVAMRHQDLLEELAGKAKGHQPWGVAPVVAAFARAALVHGQKQRTLELMDYVVAGLWKSAKDPFKKLFDRIMREGRGDKRLPAHALYALTVGAIRAALDGRELSMIYTTTIDFPVPKGALD